MLSPKINSYKRYSTKLPVLLMLLLSPTFLTKAQVVYTDVVPDSTVSANTTQQISSYFIDFDNDGTSEFELRHFNPGVGNEDVELHGETIGSKEVIIDGLSHAKVMKSGDTVGPNSNTWGNDTYGILDTSWYGAGDKYFGFRFKKVGQWHYGWARVHLPSNHLSFTIKDYAYQSSPNLAIKPGEGITTEVWENTKRLRKIIPRVVMNSHRKVEIFFPEIGQEQYNVVLYDILGRSISHSKMCRSKNDLILTNVNVGCGVYVYNVLYNNELVYSGKFIIQNHD